MEHQSPLFAGPQHVLLRPWLDDGRLEVYEAEHVATNERRLVLLASREILCRGRGVNAWLEGARASRHIRHAGLAQLVAAEPTEEGGAFASYHRGAGKSLRHVVAQGGAMQLETACNVALELLSALDVAHSAGMPHGAICPDTVTLSSQFGAQPQALLLGLGPCAAVRRHPTVHDAPERAAGSPADERSDIYSVAALIVSMLAPEAQEAPQRWVATAPLSEALRDTLLSALAPEPERRPASARTFGFELGGFSSKHSILPSAAGGIPSLEMPTRKAIRPDRTANSLRANTLPNDEPARERLRRASVPLAPTLPRFRVPRGPSPRPPLRRTPDVTAGPATPRIDIHSSCPPNSSLRDAETHAVAPIGRARSAEAKAAALAAAGFGLGIWLAWLTGLI